jgi:hypothetical protein
MVVVLLCALAVLSAGRASAASWSGTAHGKIERSTRLVSGGTSWQGNFWFTTGRGGTVRGHAVVGYEPSVNVSGLNNAIAYAKAVVSGALGAVGGLGVLGSFASQIGTQSLGLIVGAGVSFKQAMAVREGPLTGRLSGGRLSLRWKRPSGIPYDISLQYVGTSERIGGGTAALPSPFKGAAQVTNGRHAVSVSQPQPSTGGVTETNGSYWVANRVG